MQVKNISYISLFIILILISSNLFGQLNNKVDEQGKKQGLWTKYKDGVKFYEGHFKDGYPVGEFSRYYPSGRLMLKSTYSEQGSRRLSEFYYDERKSQLKAKGLFIDKKKEGAWLIYNESGILVSEEHYKNDTANGVWKLHNYFGSLVKETPYSMGRINGLQKEYFEKGNLKRVISFKMDTVNGSTKIYFPEGQIRIEGYYNFGLQDKDWTYYEANGDVLFIETYQEGVMIKRLDANGKDVEMEFEIDTVRLDVDPSEMKFE